MDLINKLDELIKNLGNVGKEGIPLKHEVDSKTVTEFGLWIVGGLLLAGIAAGTMVGLFNKRK